MVAITKYEYLEDQKAESVSLTRQLWQRQLLQLEQREIPRKERLHWMMQSREVFFDAELELDDYKIMLDLAVRLCDWSLVISLCNELIGFKASLTESEYLMVLLDLSDAHIQRGMPDKAQNVLRKALFEHYQNTEAFSYFRFAQNHSQKLNSLPFPKKACIDGELLLTPMEKHHLQSFRWAYSQHTAPDEQDNWQGQSIAQLCNLPTFKNNKHWKHWLSRRQQEANTYLFSIIHSEWGLIGSVSLEVFDGVGFFYYWLGEDFQGMGFGPKAVKLLLDIGAEYLGMRSCYAKVYDYNQPSQKALEKIGFQKLPFEVMPPYDNEWIYYFGEPLSLEVIAGQLESLLVRLDSKLVIDFTQNEVCIGY